MKPPETHYPCISSLIGYKPCGCKDMYAGNGKRYLVECSRHKGGGCNYWVIPGGWNRVGPQIGYGYFAAIFH